MTLMEFQKYRGINSKQMAALCDVSPAGLDAWHRRTRTPTVESMNKIMRATGGMVTPRDLWPEMYTLMMIVPIGITPNSPHQKRPALPNASRA